MKLCRDSVLALLNECSDMTGSGRVRPIRPGQAVGGQEHVEPVGVDA